MPDFILEFVAKIASSRRAKRNSVAALLSAAALAAVAVGVDAQVVNAAGAAGAAIIVVLADIGVVTLGEDDARRLREKRKGGIVEDA